MIWRAPRTPSSRRPRWWPRPWAIASSVCPTVASPGSTGWCRISICCTRPTPPWWSLMEGALRQRDRRLVDRPVIGVLTSGLRCFVRGVTALLGHAELLRTGCRSTSTTLVAPPCRQARSTSSWPAGQNPPAISGEGRLLRLPERRLGRHDPGAPDAGVPDALRDSAACR